MFFAAKLVWNIDQWVKPSGLAQIGVPVGRKYFGLEEWLFNPSFFKLKIGYLDCYRSSKIDGVKDVMLFTLNLIDRKVYIVGKITGVRQLNNDFKVINEVREELPQNWISEIVKKDFERISPDFATALEIYRSNNWYSNEVIDRPHKVFIANIQYTSIDIFPKDKWICLSDIDSSVNKKWRRLGKLYSTKNLKNVNDLFGF